MLSYDERALLFGLARDHFNAQGFIVDAGTFVGGSTLALATGLTARGEAAHRTIHSYDRLELDEYAKGAYPLDFAELPVGSSLRPVFEENLAAYRQLIVLHEGDVRGYTWDAAPIEILFIDIAKSWEVNAHVVSQARATTGPCESQMPVSNGRWLWPIRVTRTRLASWAAYANRVPRSVTRAKRGRLTLTSRPGGYASGQLGSAPAREQPE